MIQIALGKIKKDRLNELYMEARRKLIDNEQMGKNIIKNLARLIDEENLIPTQFICEEIVRRLAGCCYRAGPQYIRKCLEKKYKRNYEKEEPVENAPTLNINEKKVQEKSTQLNEASYREMIRTLLQICERNARDVILQNLIREKKKRAARILELERKVTELQSRQIQTRRIMVPTDIGVQLLSMQSSNVTHANIIIENGTFVGLES